MRRTIFQNQVAKNQGYHRLDHRNYQNAYQQKNAPHRISSAGSSDVIPWNRTSPAQFSQLSVISTDYLVENNNTQ